MADNKRVFSIFNRSDKLFFIVLMLVLALFTLTSLYSYLLFHTIAELFSIVIAVAIFIIAWNSRDYIDNNYLLFIGIAYLFIGGMDFLHTMAYKGMNIFTGFDANLPTQLWIAGRYLEAGSLIAAALLISRKTSVYKELTVYLIIFSLLVFSVFDGLFPVCYIEGQGLTTFKIVSEYIICLMLALSIYLLYRQKESFEPKIFSLILISIFFTILAELSFTFYVNVYGFSNLAGHLFKIISFALIYYALVEAGIRRPYEVVFRNLAEKEREATEDRDKLRMYMDIAGAMFLILDNKGIVRQINRKGCEILGYDEDEIIGKNFIENFIPEDKRDEGFRMFSDVVEERHESYISLEYDVLTKKGEIKTLLWQNSVIRDQNGDISGAVISGEDITARKETESILERTQFAFDHSPDEIYFVNSEGRLVYANKHAREVFGIKTRETIETTIFDFNPEFSREKWNQLWAEIKTKGKTRFNSVHRLPDGSRYPVDINEHLIAHDGYEYTCTISRDISEQKQNEDKLREKEAQLRTLIRTIPDLVWLKDENGIYLACNEIFERFFGAKEEDIKGKTDYDFIDRELAESFRKHDQRSMDAGKPTVNEEWITFADDGHRAYLETIKTPMHDSGGKLIGVLGIGRDITRRKEIEEILLKSEAELKKLNEDLKIIIDNAPEMIIYKDTKNNFIRVNPKAAEVFGLPQNEIEGKSGSELFSQYNEVYFKDDLEVIASGKPKFGIIEPLITTKGEKLWIRTDKIPLKAQKGEVYGILLFITDITEQKKNEDALKEINRKLNLLSSITRHDILNQITVAAGYLELIEFDQEIPPGTKTEESLLKISKAIEIIQRQITFTGYYKDLGEQAPQWFDAGHLIEKVSKNIGTGEIKLYNNINDLEVFADPLFEKVIYNLIDNAIKHGEKITKITFSAEKKPEELLIICEDDGVGIPDEFKEKIFRREHYKNSGLGLFLSKEILEITGLTIYETGTPGEGARFEIHVPEGKFRSKSLFKGGDK